MNKNRLFFLFKLLVSGAIIAYIISTVDLQALQTAVTNANFTILLISFLMHGIGYIVSAYRWQRLLSAQGYHVPTMPLINSYFVATFFNNFLPTTIGGDAVRAYDTARFTRSPVASMLGIVAVDRLTGLMALFIASLVAFVLGLNIFGQDIAFSLTLVLMAVIILMAVLITNSKVTHLLNRTLTLPVISKVAGKIQNFYTALANYKQLKSELVKTVLLALILQANVIVHYYLISVALDQQVSLLYFFLIIPILIAGLQVAPSINGIGYREAGFVFFLSKVGVDTTSAVSLSFIAFSMIILLSLIGGLVFALRKERFDVHALKGSRQEVAKV